MLKYRAAYAKTLWANKLYWLLGLIGAGLGIRLFFLLFIQRVDWDGIFYLIYAQNILGGKWLEPSPEWSLYPLGYPLLVAVFTHLFSEIEQAGLIVSLLAGAALVIPVWAIAKRLGTRLAALLTGSLLVTNGILVRYSIAVLSEALFTIILLSLVWLWVEGFTHTHGRWYWILLFFVELALVFVRAVGLILVWGTILVFIFGYARRNQRLLQAFMLAMGVTALYFFYSQSVSAHLKARTGVSPPSYALEQLSIGLSEYYATDAVQTAKIVKYQPGMSGLNFLGSNAPLLAMRYVKLVLERISVSAKWENNNRSNAVFPLFLIPFAVLGIWLFRGNLQTWLPLVGILPYVLALPLFAADPRYYVPLVPIFLIYAGLGLASILERKRFLGIGLTVSAILICILQAYQFNFHEWPIPTDLNKEIGIWLHTNEKPDLVLSTHPAVGFYAKAPFRFLTPATWEAASKSLYRKPESKIFLVADTSLPTGNGSPICRDDNVVCDLVFSKNTGVTRVFVYIVKLR